MPKLRGASVTSRRPCPVCNSHEAQYLHTMHFALPETSPLPANYNVVVCVRCGSGFADSDAPADAYNEYYQSFSKYEDSSVATGGGDDPADRQRIEELADFLSGYLPHSARIVDIGCGNGGLLSTLKNLGFSDLTGFDPSPACIAHVQSKGIDAFNITLPLNNMECSSFHPERPFDLIVLSHVLEHVFDARAVLVSLLPLLAVGGRIYIETPDPARYDTHQFPPFYFFDPEHINHFGKGALAFLADSLNLKILTIDKKTLRLSNGTHYPAVFGLFELSHLNSQREITGESVYGLLANYLEESRLGINQLKTRILALIGDGTPFVLWGAGSLAQRLIGESWFPLDLLQAVVDRDSKKQGLRFAGKTIVSPEIGLRNLPEKTLILCAAAIATGRIEQDYCSLGLPYKFHLMV